MQNHIDFHDQRGLQSDFTGVLLQELANENFAGYLAFAES